LRRCVSCGQNWNFDFVRTELKFQFCPDKTKIEQERSLFKLSITERENWRGIDDVMTCMFSRCSHKNSSRCLYVCSCLLLFFSLLVFSSDHSHVWWILLSFHSPRSRRTVKERVRDSFNRFERVRCAVRITIWMY
jgi:hypothetical protein